MIAKRKGVAGPHKILVSLSAAPSKVGIADLEALIVRARTRYYTSGKFLKTNVSKNFPLATKLLDSKGIDVGTGVEIIDDDTFDLLWDTLTEVAPKSAVLKKTGQAIRGKTQARLPYVMNGLSQMRPDTVEDWLAKHPGPYVVSDKKDGVSLEIVHGKSGSTDAYTKGDSELGNVVTPMVSQMRVPRLRMDVAVRAEMIMKKSVFDAKHSKILKDEGKKYENARNMVAGATNPKRTALHPALGDIEVIAYELLTPRKIPSEQFKFLEQLGYKVAPWKIFKTLTSAGLTRYLAERKAKSDYELDGLVIAQDKAYKIATNEEPASHMVKFKDNSQVASALARVVCVEWNPSKTGQLMPTVVIEKIR